MTLQPQIAQPETYTSYHTVPQIVPSKYWSDSCYYMRTLSMQMVIPTTSEVNHTRPQHVFQCLNGALYLPICLRMEATTELYLRA